MVSADVTVLNSLGLHARPIAKLVKVLSAVEDCVTLDKAGRTADAKDIYQMIALNAKCGDQLRVAVTGATESETLDAVVKLFALKFNEA